MNKSYGGDGKPPRSREIPWVALIFVLPVLVGAFCLLVWVTK